MVWSRSRHKEVRLALQASGKSSLKVGTLLGQPTGSFCILEDDSSVIPIKTTVSRRHGDTRGAPASRSALKDNDPVCAKQLSL